MPSGIPIDYDDVHRFLWQHADRLGRLKLNQKDLAEHYGINKFTASRVVTRLLEEQRIRKIGNDKRNRGVFMITDPDVFDQLRIVEAEQHDPFAW